MVTNFYKTYKVLFGVLLLQLFFCNNADAQFSQGNLVVIQVGSGVAVPTSAANPLKLIEYTTAGAATGTIVVLPSAGVPQITCSGSATSEGMIALSAERDRILVAGYDAAAGTANVATSTSTAVNREIFAVTQAGTYSKVAFTATAYSGNNIRGATANGTNYYSSGPSVGNELLNSSLQLSTAATNTRAIQIYNGQLYFSSSSGSFLGVSSMGTGVPVTNGQTATLLAASGSAYGFSISPNGTTLYVADDAGGVNKYTFNGATYTLAYNVTTTQTRGIAVDYTTIPYTIYATTTETTGNHIIKIPDNGVTSAYTQIATAAVNTVYRGLVWSPVLCPTVTASATASVTCNAGSNGAITLFVTGGVAPYTYAWSGPAGYNSTLSNISNIPAGTYTVNVTASSGCTVTATATVSQPTAITPIFTPTSVLCFGGSTGSIATATTGGTAPYTYSWSGPSGYSSTMQNITGLASGIYTCTVTDANNCTITQSAPVAQPTVLAASINNPVNVLCNGSATGSATVNVSGGVPTYMYAWAPSGGNAATASNLAAGTYTCTSTDANNCTITQTVTITQPATAVSSGITGTNVLCFGNATGSATVTPTGGMPGYTYSWSPTGGNAATASNLAANTYTCTITDANLCAIQKTITITQPASGIVSGISGSNILCFGGTSGTASVAPTGGTGAYTYAWAPSGGNAATANNLAAGTYTCTITDASLCSIQKTITLTQPASAVSSGISATNVLCFGTATGSATVTPTGGTPNYTYAWAPSGGNAATANNLAAGSYTCTITDANLCSVQKIIVITQPSSAVTATITGTNILCFGNASGSATVTPMGGTPNYTYSWAPSGGNGATAGNLAAGTYTCTITDANLCSIQKTITITQPATGLNATIAHMDVDCFGNATGSATVTPTGGTGGYTYSWAPSGGNAATAINLAVGTYTCTITDGNACPFQISVTISQPAALAATVSQTDVVCNGGSTGSATVNITAGTGTAPYSYSWSPSGGNGATASNLAAGNYTCTVTDAHNCIITETFTITQPAAMTASLSGNATICNGNNTQLTFNATANTTITYDVNGMPQTIVVGGAGTVLLTVNPNATTTYSLVSIQDNVTFCTQNISGTVTVTVNPLPTPSITANGPLNFCQGSNVILTENSGTGMYYQWKNVSNIAGATNQSYTVTLSGTYTVVDTNSFGCYAVSAPVIVNVSALPATPTASSNSPVCNNNTLSLEANCTTPGVTYTWDGPAGFHTNTQNPLINNAQVTNAGVYTVTVSLNGCNALADAQITVIVNPSPVAPTVFPIEYCQYETPGSLTVVGQNILWYTTPTGGSGTINAPVPSTTTPGVFTWYASQTVAGCEGPRVAVNVLIKSKPQAPTTNTPAYTYCQFNTATILTATGDSLQWYTVPTGGTGSFSAPTPATSVAGVFTYYVSQTINACESERLLITVTVTQKPTAPVTTDVTYCQNTNATPLTAEGQNLLWYTVATGGTGLATAPIPNTTVAGITTWYVSQTVNGCESDRSALQVTVYDAPTAGISSSDTAICQYKTASFSSNSANVPSETYLWTIPVSATLVSGSLTSAGPIVLTFNNAGQQTVTLLVTVGGKCSANTSLTINVLPSPDGTISMEKDLCPLQTGTVLFNSITNDIDSTTWNFYDATLISSPQNQQGPYKLSWSVPGKHIVSVVVNNKYCPSKTISDTVIVHENPTAEILPLSTTTICAGDSIKFDASYAVENSYEWTPAQFFKGTANEPTPYGVVTISGDVTLNVTSPFGCTAATSVHINAQPCCEVSFPNAFTPNGDGRNDRFRPITLGHHKIDMFRIVNRWGQTVYSTTDEREGWDGSFNGVPQDMGSYNYYIKFKCENGNDIEQKGEMILVR